MMTAVPAKPQHGTGELQERAVRAVMPVMRKAKIGVVDASTTVGALPHNAARSDHQERDRRMMVRCSREQLPALASAGSQCRARAGS
jgi:hypothetical protein